MKNLKGEKNWQSFQLNSRTMSTQEKRQPYAEHDFDLPTSDQIVEDESVGTGLLSVGFSFLGLLLGPNGRDLLGMSSKAGYYVFNATVPCIHCRKTLKLVGTSDTRAPGYITNWRIVDAYYPIVRKVKPYFYGGVALSIAAGLTYTFFLGLITLKNKLF